MTSTEENAKFKNYLPFRMHYLTPELKQKAKLELNETDENRGPCLEELRKLVLAEKGLTCPNEDRYLLQFLRARKFNVGRAFQLLQNMYRVKKMHMELYAELNKDEIKALIMSGPVYFLPYRDQDGCPVLLLKACNWNPEEYDIVTIMRTLTGLLLFLVFDEATQVSGVRIMVDVEGFTFAQLRCFTIRYIILITRALRNCLPIRYKGIHIYNESPVMQSLWTILKTFLPEKLKKRVHFHREYLKSVYKYIPQDIMPIEYGGKQPNFTGKEQCWVELEDDYDEFMRIIRSGYE